MNIKNKFKREESFKILVTLCLISTIEKYQEIYNHVWKKNIIK